MPRNRLQRIVPDRLAEIAASVVLGIGFEVPNPFSVSQSAIDELVRTSIGHREAQRELDRARLSYHAAVLAHDAARVELAQTLAAVANVCYAAPGVNAEMIMGLGLSPRATTRTRAVPKAPEGLVAEVRAPDGVLLRFGRGGNVQGTTFHVESWTGDGPWTLVTSSQRTRIALWGCAPGLEKAFRIVAVKNERRSPASNVATIYAGSALRKAA